MAASRSVSWFAVGLLILAGILLVVWHSPENELETVGLPRLEEESEAPTEAAEVSEGNAQRVEEVDDATEHDHTPTVSGLGLGGLFSGIANAVVPKPQRSHTFQGVVVTDGQPVPYGRVRAYETSEWGEDPEDAESILLDCNAAGEFQGELSVDEYSPIGLLPMADGMMAKDRLLIGRDAPADVQGVTLTLFPSLEFQGKVVQEQDLPVESAEVEVELESRWSRTRAGAVENTTFSPLKKRTAQTDAFGQFTVTLVDAPHDFRATHEEWGNASRHAYAPSDGPLLLKLKQPEEKPGSRIVGTVYGPDGQPAVGADVHFVTRGPRTKTDENGEFVLAGVEKHWALEPEIYAWMEGAAPQGVAIGELAPLVGPVRVELPEGLIIEGTLRDEEGAAVEGRNVFLLGLRTFGDGTSPPSSELSIFGIDTDDTTDAEGRFRFDSLPEGVYSVVVASNRYEVEGSVQAQAGERDVELTLNEVLAPSLTVRGRVVHAHTGEPLAGAQIQVNAVSRSGASGWSASSVRTITTGPDGVYVGEGLPLGEYYFEALKDGYARGKTEPEVEAEGEKTIDFRLYPERTVTVKVVDAKDKPVPQASVWIHDADGTEMMIWTGGGSGSTPGRTDDSGTLIAHRMPGGPCKIEVRARNGGGDRIAKQVDLSADTEHVVTIQLPIEL